jgi:hypothetical protein
MITLYDLVSESSSSQCLLSVRMQKTVLLTYRTCKLTKSRDRPVTCLEASETHAVNHCLSVL